MCLVQSLNCDCQLFVIVLNISHVEFETLKYHATYFEIYLPNGQQEFRTQSD